MEMTLARGRVAGPVALFVVAGLVLLGVGYAAGLINTLGYEKRTVTFSGYGTGSKSGGGVGLKHMVFFEGQSFFAKYDAVVREGSLRIGILKAFGPIGDKPHFVKAVELSGRGEVTYRIPETGVYSIYFEGSPSGRGYDLSYTMRWGAR
jgi:hypothetical protein